MTECNSCGAFVTKDFARVFGTNDGEVYACPNCATMVELADDALAATPR